jgi:polyhydroxybutyrate depolymerase
MKKILFALALVALYASAAASEYWTSQLPYENKQREFRVFVPSSYKKSPMPLVVVLHGGKGSSNQAEKHTGFSRLAEKEGFITAYPQGLDRQWNDGREKVNSTAHKLKTDDTGFILKMLGAIKASYKIDTSRIYVCGISNGGFMSMRLACRVHLPRLE